MTRDVYLIDTFCSKEVATERIIALNRIMSGLMFSDCIEIMLTAVSIAIGESSADADDSWNMIIEMIERKRRGLALADVAGNA